MILYLTQGMASLALRVKEYGDRRQVTDWKCLQLLIQCGEMRPDCAQGSPWILTGCWPGKRTNEDIANWRPDFPTICYDAHELDADGRVVFLLDNRLWCLPPGRYNGTLRASPRGKMPWGMPYNLTHDLSREALPKKLVIPAQYRTSMCCNWRPPDPEFCPEPPECCILARFDIDLGPACHDHMIDQAAVEHAVNHCGAENGEA